MWQSKGTNEWKLLDQGEITKIHDEVMDWEPGTLDVRDDSVLDEAVNNPGYDYVESLEEAVYILARSIAQAHPFEDGNKRTALRAVRKMIKHNAATPTKEQMGAIRGLVWELAAKDPIKEEAFVTQLKTILGH